MTGVPIYFFSIQTIFQFLALCVIRACIRGKNLHSHLVNPLSIFFLSKNTVDLADEKNVV